jgi:hypothetical protein
MFFLTPAHPPLASQPGFASVPILDRGETAMKALEVFAIYVTPFLILGVAIRFWMKRHGVDLPEVEKQVGPKPKRRFLLGAWRTED